MTLFDDDTTAAMNAGLTAELTAQYEQKLLDNPPTPTFMETNPKREAAARYAARCDVTRFLAVLDAMGLTIGRKETR